MKVLTSREIVKKHSNFSTLNLLAIENMLEYKKHGDLTVKKTAKMVVQLSNLPIHNNLGDYEFQSKLMGIWLILE